MKHLIALAAGLSLTLAACTQKSPTFDPQRLSGHVKTLSSDEFEGRGPDTAGEQKTVEYLIGQMQSAKLSPGGDLVDGQRGWTQAVPLGRFEITGPIRLELTAAGKTQALTQGEEIAVRAAMNGSSGVKFDGVPLVFVGYGVHAPERQWDDFKGVDLQGKIGIVLVNDPDFEAGTGDFGGKAMTYYGRWTYKYEEAARRGAVGMLVVHETEPASYGWATVKNSNTAPMFDIVRSDPARDHVPMEGWIQRDFAVDLFKLAGLDFEAQKRLAQTREFQPVVLEGATLSADYAVDAHVITSRNVVGILEGSQRPDETVIYSGHWDHLSVGLPDAEGDTIYNGAVDNGTGMAALLELGRAFAAGRRPARSVVFLMVTAEEKGLLGSEYYAANPLYPLGKTVSVINLDALNPWGPARDFSISGSAKLDLLDRLVAAAGKMDMSLAPDSKPEAGLFFRSDHFPFAKRGVPAVSYGSGKDWVDGGREAGLAESKAYTEVRYHQPADEWQAEWPFTGLARDLQLVYQVGADLANSDAWPNWSADSEFRAARDATADERP